MFESISRKAAVSAVVLGLSLAFGASAQTTGSTGSAAATGTSGTKAPSTASSKKSNPDQGFIDRAAMGGMAEVELGNIAQQKASSEEVKQFASRMVQDHGKSNDELKQIASAKGLQLPAALDKKHRGDIDRLGKMSGAQFDRAYMSHMVDDHKKDIGEFKKEASGGKDTELKAFASKTLPTLEEHLKLAQKTNDAVKKGDSASAGSTGAATGTSSTTSGSSKAKKGGC